MPNKHIKSYLTTDLTLEELLDNNQNFDQVGEIINEALSEIYACIYGYKDSMLFQQQDDLLEKSILSKKIELEHYFLYNWLDLGGFSEAAFENQKQLAVYFEKECINSLGMHHQFFDFVADQMNKEQMTHFLKTEICRNEYVDDEVAFLTVGLQGQMKKVASSNLWDECGCGVLKNFHTYWLRRLMLQITSYEDFLTWRNGKPWQFSLTSNIFNCLLTNPALKLAAYGCFTTTEQWVECHFEKNIRGMQRVGLNSKDTLVYLDKHKTNEVSFIYRGSQLAIKVAVLVYDLIYRFYQKNQDIEQ